MHGALTSLNSLMLGARFVLAVMIYMSHPLQHLIWWDIKWLVITFGGSHIEEFSCGSIYSGYSYDVVVFITCGSDLAEFHLGVSNVSAWLMIIHLVEFYTVGLDYG